MFKKAMIASALLAGVFAAQAQTIPPAGWTVGGSVAPAVCTISVTGTPTIGVNVPAATVKAWSTGTSLGVAAYNQPVAQRGSIDLSALCPSPTKVALHFQDSRSGTSIATAATQTPYAFGLGTTNATGTSANVGAYYLSLANLQIKATSAATAAAPVSKVSTAGAATSTSTWAAYTATVVGVNTSLGFSATAAATTPDSLVEISGNMPLTLALSKAVVDAATGVITLDGAGTVTLISL